VCVSGGLGGFRWVGWCTCSRRLGTTKVANVFKEAFLLYKVKHSDSTNRLGAHTTAYICMYIRPQRTEEYPVFNNGLNLTQLSWLCPFIYSCKHALRLWYTHTAAVNVLVPKDQQENPGWVLGIVYLSKWVIANFTVSPKLWTKIILNLYYLNL